MKNLEKYAKTYYKKSKQLESELDHMKIELSKKNEEIGNLQFANEQKQKHIESLQKSLKEAKSS